MDLKQTDNLYSIYQVSSPSRNSSDSSRTKIMSHKIVDVPMFFRPLVNVMHFFGFLSVPGKSGCFKLCSEFLTILRTMYLIFMWTWTILMSVNIFWLTLAETTGDGVSPVDGQRANMIITMLNETPYAFITIRNATILSLFVSHGPSLLQGIKLCEELREKIAAYGVTLSMEKSNKKPLVNILVIFVLIVLWECHEWNVWFITLGVFYDWPTAPFPFKIPQWQYATLWIVFTTIPFIFSQLALLFPVLFACVVRKFIKFVNTELQNLERALDSDIPELVRVELGQRLSAIRKFHFEIGLFVHKVDKLIRAMLLWEFIFDTVVMFGFVGLLINSKDVKPPKMTIEWTFFIPSSIIWFGYFLFYFSFPLIRMANESERTHTLVHALTFTSAHQDKFRDFHVFLEETKHTVIAFTGGNFYHINRAYIVTLFALLASYITVLCEILDRFYGTLEIKAEIANLAKLIGNYTNTTVDLHSASA